VEKKKKEIPYKEGIMKDIGAHAGSTFLVVGYTTNSEGRLISDPTYRGRRQI
jgi:hypothetical protein